MIAGISRGSVRTALELVEFAATAGYDAALVKRPASLREGQLRETVTFFQAVADRSPIPVILDSVPTASLTVDAVLELSSHNNVIGLLDGDPSVERIEQVRASTSAVKREVTVTTVFAAVTRRMLAVKEQPGAASFVAAESLGAGAAVATAPPRPAIRTRTKTVGFQVIAASSAGMLAGLKAGAVGVMPAFAAAAPQASYEVYAAWKDEDQALAEEKQLRIAPAIATVEAQLGVPGIRYASDLNGYFGGRPRLPLLALSGHEREAVERVMDGIRN
jgi:dihydrodipicolinate synthase/N-acetylneuraminate lyase